jgi:hypothetical protein
LSHQFEASCVHVAAEYLIIASHHETNFHHHLSTTTLHANLTKSHSFPSRSHKTHNSQWIKQKNSSKCRANSSTTDGGSSRDVASVSSLRRFWMGNLAHEIICAFGYNLEIGIEQSSDFFLDSLQPTAANSSASHRPSEWAS